MSTTTTVKGRMIRNKENPFDFNAVNSLFSDMFPKVIKEERRMASGRAKGIKLAET